MTLQNQKKLSSHIIRLLKVPEITYPIGRTLKGNLGITFSENTDYTITLDSIPLSTKSIYDDENNIELKRMIEKYLFEADQNMTFSVPFVPTTSTARLSPIKKKGGRPLGSKNKKHGDNTTKETSQ